MKIGIIADTHDNLEAAKEAVDFFNDRNVSHVLHAGDLISPFVVEKFSKLEAEFHYVWGNNDGSQIHINSKLEEIGANPGGKFKSLDIDGIEIALLHGVEESIVDSLAKDSKFDLVVRGHTHETEVREDSNLINPGPASGYLAGKRTVAIFDTEKMKGDIFEI